ncbi:MAG: hypothetical protein ACYTGV_06485 [Planctomycetota bacterium]|jgi:hypothetical protein
MNVTFGCPSCGRGVESGPDSRTTCRRCGAEASLPPAAEGPLGSCLACGCEELYRQRDFNQKLGLLLIALGAVLALSFTSFLPMIAAALLDLVLYLLLPDVAICYRCKAHHRGFEGTATLQKFDLERFEHYRFLKAKEEEANGEAR